MTNLKSASTWVLFMWVVDWKLQKSQVKSQVPCQPIYTGPIISKVLKGFSLSSYLVEANPLYAASSRLNSYSFCVWEVLTHRTTRFLDTPV